MVTSTQTNCLEAYLALCDRYQLPGPWDFVPADPNAYTTPADPVAALKQLSADCSEAELVSAGLAQLTLTGGLEVHPFLALPRAPIVALIDPKLHRVGNLMTGNGCIVGFRYPLFAVVFEEFTYRAIESFCRELFLTGTLEEAILLRSLGFAAAPIVGVTQLSERGVSLLGKYFGLRREPYHKDSACLERSCPQDKAVIEQMIYPEATLDLLPGCHRVGPNAADENFVPLSVVNWSPLQLSSEVPSAVKAALAFLRELAAAVRLRLYNLKLWSPSAQRLRAMQFAVDKREISWLKKTVFKSLDESHEDCEAVAQRNSPTDLATAIEGLQSVFLRQASGRGSRTDREDAIEAYRLAVQRDLIRPMSRQAQAVGDPFERARQMQLVDLATLWFERMLTTREELFVNAPSAAKSYKQLGELLALSKQFTALHNGQKQNPWKHQTAISPLRPRSQKNVRSSKDWDFLRRN